MDKRRAHDHSSETNWDLPQLVAALRTARRSDASSVTPPHGRPSRDVVQDVLRDLRAVLFPTHFGVTDYTDTSIDFFVGHRLDAALRALQGQVRRAFSYGAEDGDASDRTLQHAHSVVVQFANTLPEIRRMLEAHAATNPVRS